MIALCTIVWIERMNGRFVWKKENEQKDNEQQEQANERSSERVRERSGEEGEAKEMNWMSVAL